MNVEVANRLQQLRKAKGLSQEELANILGLSRQAISKWERAETSPDTDNLICLAKLYNISIDSLLDTDESLDEIKERIAQERIDEVNNKSDVDTTIDTDSNEIINDIELEFSDEQKDIKDKKDKIISLMYSSAFTLFVFSWIVIGQINKDSWKWGWVFGVMTFCFIYFFEEVFIKKRFNIIGIGASFLFFFCAFSICAGEDLEVNRVFPIIGIAMIALQIIVQLILYLVFFRKNRKTVEEVYHIERLIEMKHEYEKKIEKLIEKNK